MARKNEIKVLLIKAGEKPTVTIIQNDLKSMQNAVEGLIEIISFDNAVLVCNEEGKINGLPGNRKLDNGDIIAGNFFIAGEDGQGNLTDLSEKQIEKFENRFSKIESYTPQQVQEALFIRFMSW